MPAWVTIPNVLTLARIATIPFIARLLLQQRYEWALPLLFLSGISDGFDGYLARRLNQSSALGRILDPAADKLLLLVLYLTMGWTGALPWWLTLLVIGRDVVIVLGALLLTTSQQRREFVPTSWGKISTFYQMMLPGCVVIHGVNPLWMPDPALQFLLAGTTAVTLLSGVDYVRLGAKMAYSPRA